MGSSASKYDDGTRGAALAALLAGNTPRRVAEEHGIPLNTVKSWRRSDEKRGKDKEVTQH